MTKKAEVKKNLGAFTQVATVFQQDAWVALRPVCHPGSLWNIRHTMRGKTYSFWCGECDKKYFEIVVA